MTFKDFDIKRIMKYGDKRDLPAIIRLVVFVICVLFLVIFCFNLFKFNLNAPVSSGEVKKNIEEVGSYDFGKVKKIESTIKALEANEITVNTKTRSSVYYIKKFKNDVVLGDSVTEGLTVYGYLQEDQVFCAIGASLVGSGKMFKKAAKTYPDNAFFSFGMNDLITYRGKVKPFIKQYSKMLKDFRKRTKDTEMYINSISVPNKAAIKRQKSLGHYKEYNKALEKLCEDEGYTFIDNTYILKKNKKLYAGDGIHVAPAYYPLWLNDMITEAGL